MDQDSESNFGNYDKLSKPGGVKQENYCQVYGIPI